MSRIPPDQDCAVVQAELGAFVDAELSQEQSRSIEHHLAGCPVCRGEAQALRMVRQAVQQLPRPAPPEALRLRLRAQLKAEVVADPLQTEAQTVWQRHTRISYANPAQRTPVSAAERASSPARVWRLEVVQDARTYRCVYSA